MSAVTTATIKEALRETKTCAKIHKRISNNLRNKSSFPLSVGQIPTEMPAWLAFRGHRALRNEAIRLGFDFYAADRAAWELIEEIWKEVYKPYRMKPSIQKNSIEYYSERWDNMVV